MALSYKARKRWALVILLLALPAYILAALWLTTLFPRPSFVLELLLYIGLGVIWIFPLKAVFKGVGQADPDADDG